MARIITKEHALQIARKLHAIDESKPNSAHQKWCIYHNGKLVTHFGVRHGSSKDAGHDHVQKALNVSTHFALELAICTKSDDDYLRKIGHLPALPSSKSELPEST
jgi:predicted glutamine amidotransferase